MGLLDLPAPLFQQLDSLAEPVLPPAVRLAAWALLGAVVSTELYRALAPRPRIAEARRMAALLRRRLAGYDGDFEGARELIGQTLAMALRRTALVLPAALAASLPLLMLIVWLSTAYGYRLPLPGEQAAAHVEPTGYTAGWQAGGNSAPPQVVVTDAARRAVLVVPVTAPVTAIEKRHWWNLLIGNPAGYLPKNAPVERISLQLPERQVLPAGPDWLRGWMPSFMGVLFVAAVLLHRLRCST